MATAVSADAKFARLNVARCAFTGAAVLIVLFVLCWTTAAAGVLNASHAFISLFTPAEVSSFAALIEGALWALGFGALVATFYNIFRFAGRR